MPENWNEQLREWFGKCGKTQKQISRETGIPRSSFGDYIYGRRTNLDALPLERRKKLYDLTGLDCFNPGDITESEEGEVIPISDASMVKELDSLESQVRLLRRDMAAKTKRYSLMKEKLTIEERVYNIKNLFYLLIEELEFFKTVSPQERKKLTKAIKAAHVGYLTSFLNALYRPEDEFRGWLYNVAFQTGHKVER